MTTDLSPEEREAMEAAWFDWRPSSVPSKLGVHTHAWRAAREYSKQREEDLQSEVSVQVELVAELRVALRGAEIVAERHEEKLREALRRMIAVTELPGTRSELSSETERAKSFARAALAENGDTMLGESELVEMPADLVRVLRDPGIIVRQDAAVFELLAKWQKASITTGEGRAENGDTDD